MIEIHPIRIKLKDENHRQSHQTILRKEYSCKGQDTIAKFVSISTRFGCKSNDSNFKF